MGNRIRQRREELRLTQQALADRVGVKQQVVGRWETEESNPKLIHIVGLVHALGVSANWLFGLDDGVPRASVEAAIVADLSISPAARDALLDAYRAAVSLASAERLG